MTKIVKSIMPLPLWRLLWGWPRPSVSAGASIKAYISTKPGISGHTHFCNSIMSGDDDATALVLTWARGCVRPALLVATLPEPRAQWRSKGGARGAVAPGAELRGALKSWGKNFFYRSNKNFKSRSKVRLSIISLIIVRYRLYSAAPDPA